MKYEQSCGSMIVLCSNGVSHVTLASLCSWMQAGKLVLPKFLPVLLPSCTASAYIFITIQATWTISYLNTICLVKNNV